MKRECFLSVALVAAMAAGGCGRDDRGAAANPAGNPAPVGTSGTPKEDDLRRGDSNFMKDAVFANRAELNMARTAVERGSTPNVKKFAQMMITDHTKAVLALERLAKQHQLEFPVDEDKDHQEHGQKLAAKRGLDFDREYADMMVDGHQAFVDKLESRIDKDTLADWKSKHVDPASGKKTEAKGEAITVVPEKSDNPVTFSLNQWAAETYPVAFAHLQAAKDLQKGLKRRTTAP
jgi:putative membrane protein